jgi:nitrogen fixation protein FixH
MARRFTGRQMLLVILAFFGVVIGVNLIMARFAVGTFGGTVVENSYVASQRFNGWLAAARDQKALGWSVSVGLDGQRRVTIEARGRDGLPLDARAITATAEHPLGRAAPVPLTFEGLAPGGYRSLQPLPAGRWTVRIEARAGSDRVRLLETLG